MVITSSQRSNDLWYFLSKGLKLVTMTLKAIYGKKSHSGNTCIYFLFLVSKTFSFLRMRIKLQS